MSTRSARPVVSTCWSPLDWLLEIIAVLGLVTSAILVWTYLPQVPDKVPTHFGFSGKPDAWGSKFSLYVAPAISFALFALVTIVSLFPRIFNYPFPITEENAARQYSLARTCLIAVKAEMAWLITHLSWGTIQTSLGRANGLGGSLSLIIPAVVFAGTLGVYLYKARKAR